MDDVSTGSTGSTSSTGSTGSTGGRSGRRRLSRRGFLSGLGIGTAGLVAARPAEALGAIVNETFAPAGSVASRFGRIFGLPSFAEATPAVRAALAEMGSPGGVMDAADALERGPIDLIIDPELSRNNRNNEFHTAGTTFMGQFLDHDITFDLSSQLGVPSRPEDTPNVRTPAFDLDSVYGRGPDGDPQLYDPADRAKLLVESNGVFEDLPRRSGGTAIIADERNDENLMVAGLHAAVLLFHNATVDFLRDRGDTGDIFAQARTAVTWHYQWIVLHEFLPLFIGQSEVERILRFGRQFYRPSGAPYIPVEFQLAYRFGHSMVRPSYRANRAGDRDSQGNPAPFFGMIFDPAGEGQPDPVDLRGGARARRRFIGWETFFDFGLREGDGVTLALKTNKRIDTRISTPLFHLPLQAIPTGDQPVALPQRNLLRHLTWEVPSGQRLAAAIGVSGIGAEEFGELRTFGQGFDASTPLWYYVLKEAQIVRDGTMLGPLGARLVGEVFIGLLQLDPASYLQVEPDWRPFLPRRDFGTFTLYDLLTFAGVDPASRGQ